MKENRLEAEWEDLCRQCGQCCFEKWVDEDGTIHPTVIACRFLDIHSRQCRVYHKRFEVGEGCIKLTPKVVETVQWLPEDCAYVRNAKKQSQVQGPKSKVKNPKMR
jgi:hypothetical protein